MSFLNISADMILSKKCKSENASVDLTAKKKEVMFDLKMKETEGIYSPRMVSSGFTLKDEWILAELKIELFNSMKLHLRGEGRLNDRAGHIPTALGCEDTTHYYVNDLYTLYNLT